MLIYCYQFLIVLIVDRQSTAIINQMIVEKICHSVNSQSTIVQMLQRSQQCFWLLNKAEYSAALMVKISITVDASISFYSMTQC